MTAHARLRPRPRPLALDIVETLGDRIREGSLAAGQKLPTEAEVMRDFGVSRTVVREALSKLQAGGLVETRHGVGTFVVRRGEAAPFRITPEHVATLRDVIALLELRIGVETEAAALAAQRRTDGDLASMHGALMAFAAAVESGSDSIGADLQFHLEIARATQNRHFSELLSTFGAMLIPRARLEPEAAIDPQRQEYLRQVHREHENIHQAITNRDSEGARAAMRTHLANSRERRRRANAEIEAAQSAATATVTATATAADVVR